MMQVAGIGVFLDLAGVFYVPAAAALGISVGEYSSFLSYSFLSTMLSAIAASYLVERVNLRVLIGINAAICGLDLALMGYYPTMFIRNIAGFVFGFCGGFWFMIMTPILINNWFAKRKGLVMGIAMSSSGIGAALLSPLITLVIETVGWQSAYLFTGLLVIVMVLPWTYFVFREKPSDLNLRPFGWEAPEKISGKGGGDRQSVNVKQGITYVRARKTPAFIFSCLFVGCIAMFAGYNSHLNAYGQSLGYSALISSTFLIAVSLGSIVEKVIMGFLYDYLGVYKIIAINLSVLTIGLFILGTQTELTFIYLGAALFGIQNSLVAVQLPLLIRELFGDIGYSKLIPLTRVGIGGLGALGPLLVSSVLNETGSYNIVWLSSIIIVAFSAFFVNLARINKRKHVQDWVKSDAV
jgi:MFS family permease